MPSYWPWNSILAGADGKIYAYYNASSSTQNNWLIYTIAPELAPLYDTNYLILRYDPQTSKWDAVAVSRHSVLLKDTLAAVDKDSNIYFYYHDNAKPPTFQITKIAPSGNVDWVLTNNDLPDTAGLAGVTSDGRLILVSNETSNTNDAQVQNSTLIPATPTPIK